MPRRPITTRALLSLACLGSLCRPRLDTGRGGEGSLRPHAAQADPGALVGAWKRVVTQADIDRTASFRELPPGWEVPLTGPYTLVIVNGSFSVRDKAGFAVAETTRVDSGGAFDILAYITPEIGAFCHQAIPQNASYTWALEGPELVLTAVDDRCADRSSILVGRWTRGSNVRTLVATSTSEKQRKDVHTSAYKLSEGGLANGTAAGICKTVSETLADCRVTLRLMDGTLVVRGKVAESRSAKLKVISGTGAYRGAKGSASRAGSGPEEAAGHASPRMT